MEPALFWSDHANRMSVVWSGIERALVVDIFLLFGGSGPGRPRRVGEFTCNDRGKRFPSKHSEAYVLGVVPSLSSAGCAACKFSLRPHPLLWHTPFCLAGRLFLLVVWARRSVPDKGGPRDPE